MAMLKFYKGLVNALPATGAEGALYITTDEGGIYLGTGTGMKRLGDFVQVENVASLPAQAHENCLYYCVAENILAKWNGTEWKQVNKQPTPDELKTLLGLGAMAYKSEVAEADLNADLKAKVNASAQANHTHANKALLDTYTQTEANLADAVAKKHEHANQIELDKIVAGDKAKWDAVVADHLVAADKTELSGAIADVNTALGNEVTRAKAAEKANADAIAAIKDDANIDSFADVVAELAKKQNVGDYATKAEAQGYADAKDAAIAEAKKAGDDAATALNTYKTANDAALAGVKTTAEKGVADAAKVAGDLANEITRATDAEKAITDSIGEVPVGKTVVEMIADAQTAATYDDTAIKADIKDNADAIDVIEADYLKAADKTELSNAITAETNRATGIEAGLRTDVDAIAADYLKAADKVELEGKITTNANAIERLTNGVSADEIDGVNDLINYVKEHGPEVTGMKGNIKANADAIDVLNGDDTTDGSVAKTVKDAVDTLNIGDYAKTTYVDGELAKKVDKETGKSLIADTEIARLAAMSDGANKVEASATNGSIKIDGVDTVVYTHPANHTISEITGLQAALDAKANAADVYTKAEAEELVTWDSF